MLTANALAPIIDEAISRWAQVLKLDERTADFLNSITFEVADLGGLTLAETAGSTITLDDDAAGYGWFVDATPGTDTEFRAPGSFAAGDMDLLTAVMHEFGHVLGVTHTTSDGALLPLMSGTLDAGERILPDINNGNGHNGRNGNGAARAMQFETMIFDDHSGGLVGQTREGRKEARLRFDPAAWTVPGAPVIDRKDEWIVEV